MGACKSDINFDALNYPSWCVLEPVTPEDEERCLQSWLKCVRNKNQCDETPFEHMKKTYFNLLDNFHILSDLKDTNFLIQLVGILIYSKYKKSTEIRKLHEYNIEHKHWSAIGHTLIAILKQYYCPYEWTYILNDSWIRIFSALMREILRS